MSSGKTEYSPNHWSSRNCTCSENCSAFARMRTSSIAHSWLHNPHSRDTSKAKCLKRRILRFSFSCRYGRSGCTLVLDRTKQNARNTRCGFEIQTPPFPVWRNSRSPQLRFEHGQDKVTLGVEADTQSRIGGLWIGESTAAQACRKSWTSL